MHKRFILINCPGLGVGDVRNTSSSQHSIETLLKYIYEHDLTVDLSGLETIGFNAFVKYDGSHGRRSSVSARLASRNIHGVEDFDAFYELGGGDDEHNPVFSHLCESSNNSGQDVHVIYIGDDDSIVLAHEHIMAESDDEATEQLYDVLSAPLVRNECVVVSMNNYRDASMDSNPTFAAASLAYLSKSISNILGYLGSDDALMVVSTTAIDATSADNEFRNELTPMMYHTPKGRTHDLGLRLLSDIGPTIAEFFDFNRTGLVGASMGKWMKSSENLVNDPQESAQSPLQS